NYNKSQSFRTWILDTSATIHVCPILSLFTIYISIKPIIVTLPDGSSTTAHYLRTIFFNEHFYLNNVLHIPSYKNNLFILTIQFNPNVQILSRLGHPSTNVMHRHCTDFPYIKYNKNLICESCHLAKQHKLTPLSYQQYQNTATTRSYPHIGPLHIPFINGHHYFLTIVDNYFRHIWLFPMKYYVS
ncbi:hypothetical protein CR513_42138, partial [Mucuna pruriens]